jgi:NhaP-type Na+/H+ or K+/H+ antiporter
MAGAMSFLSGLVVGIFVGANVGLLVFALLQSAGEIEVEDTHTIRKTGGGR